MEEEKRVYCWRVENWDQEEHYVWDFPTEELAKEMFHFKYKENEKYGITQSSDFFFKVGMNSTFTYGPETFENDMKLLKLYRRNK